MNKWKPDYFGAVLLSIPLLLIIAVGGVVIKHGLNYSPEYHLDLLGIGLIIGGLFFASIGIWEMTVLLNFIGKDFRKQITISDTELLLKIGTKEKTYKLKDLKELESVDSVFATKSLTSHLTYSKLKFSNSDEIILTSFISPIHEVEKQFGNKGVKKVGRTRKRFELIN